MKLWFTKGIWKRKGIDKKIENISFSDVKKIAILRHAALGDMLLTRSFIIEARKAFPNASITLSIVSNYTRGTPEDLVDRVHIIHGSDQREVSLGNRIKRIKELGPQDIIFDLASSSRANLTCMLTPATLKIGFPYKRFQAKMLYDIATPRSDLNFEGCEMMNMLNALGIKTAYPHRYDMPGEPLKRDKPYLIYFIGASTPSKVWPAARFTELLNRLSKDYPEHDHLVLEGIQEWETADKILVPLKDIDNIDVINADTIDETESVLKGADLVISNDTGIRHLAIVSETPTVGIFYHDPFRYWPRFEIHDVALPDEDGPASVDEVHRCCTNVLSKTQNTSD
ncbi:MAG: lipopolysaccharide heptosyltransferase family protein [Gammaproteobacteria bacterium]|nr:MAG: lipopolysaccharide heptosyltransferase family protein [Gammaproteobacteria bacterium]